MTPERREIVLLARTEGIIVEFRFGGERAGHPEVELRCSFCMRGQRSAVFAADGRPGRLCIECAKSCLYVGKSDELRRLASLLITFSERKAFERSSEALLREVDRLPKPSSAPPVVQSPPPSTTGSTCCYCEAKATPSETLYAGLGNYVCGPCLEAAARLFIASGLSNQYPEPS